MQVFQFLVAKYADSFFSYFLKWQFLFSGSKKRFDSNNDWGCLMRKRSLGVVLLTTLLFLVSGCAILKTNNAFGSEGLYVAGWLWRSAGLVTFYNAQYVKVFREINPVWYETTATASNGPVIVGSTNQSLVDWARYCGVKLIPTIQKLTRNSRNQSSATSILDDTNRARHIAAIVALVVNNKFDGIDIDYENEGLTAVDKQKFTIFIQELGQALQAQNKLLSVCVYSPHSGIDWQDWPALLPYVDSLKVMVYNADITANPAPGPISPLSVLRKTMDYVAGLSAREKIIIGLPFYGRDWKKATNGSYSKQTVYYTDMVVQNGIANYTVLRNDGEPYFQYQDSAARDHTVYFQDAEAIRERLKVIAQYRGAVKGVTFWDLGCEDPRAWDEIFKYR
jgi:spore germination protein